MSEPGVERAGAGPDDPAQRLQPGAGAVGATPSRNRDAIEERKRTVQQQRRERFAGIDLSEDQLRRLDALDDERRSWLAEHQEELDSLRGELVAARRAGDAAELDDGRARMRALQETMPDLQGILLELSDEQRAQFERNARDLWDADRRAALTSRAGESDADRRRRIEKQKEALDLRRQRRFAGAGLSEDQQRRLEGLGEARRAWNAEHGEEFSALRAELRAAAQSGDEAAAEATRGRIEALRATAPTMASILADLSDEQREQIRARRPSPRQPTPEAP